MTTYEKELFDKYITKIKVPQKSINNIIEYLGDNFYIKQINKNTSKYNQHTYIHYLNCKEIIKELNMSKEIEITMYEVSESSNYDIFKPKYIYFEKDLDYINSNNGDLLNQIIVFRGLNHSDIESQNDVLINYLLALDYLDKKSNKS